MREHFYKSNPRFRDKIFALDFMLIFLVLLLGIISFFAMYSTEQGKFGYFTQSHLYRFFIFFIVFIVVSFFKVQFWRHAITGEGVVTIAPSVQIRNNASLASKYNKKN